MGDIFYWVLNMSLSASIAGIFVLLLRCIKRIPRKFVSILWAIPFVRLIIPVGLEGKYSLMWFISQFTTKTVTIYESPKITVTNHIMAADEYFPITYKVDILDDIMNIGFYVWVTVALALMIALALVYRATTKELRDAQHIKENLYYSDKVNTPAVYGIFKPRIIFPTTNIDKYVLLHEQTHIKRGDNLWRIIGIVISCVYWFNPLIWLFLKLYLDDNELSCDEAVMDRIPREEHKEYALTLLGYSGKRTVYASPFGGAGVKTRIERIISYKKITLISSLAFLMLIIFAAYFLLTNSTGG